MSRIVTLALVATGLLSLPGSTGDRPGRSGRPGPTPDRAHRRVPRDGDRSDPTGIMAGPAGDLWFTNDNGTIGRATVTGTTSVFSAGGDSAPLDIAAAGGKLWYADNSGPTVGEVTLPTPTVARRAPC
jgi:streptogramin lyase